MALYAQPRASHPAAAEQVEGPSVDDVAELCAEFEYHIDSDDDYSLLILRDMITAAITRWRAPVAQFGDLPEPDPCLGEVVGYVMGGCDIDGKRIRVSIAVLEPCPFDEWRPIARKALKRLTAPPAAQPPAQPVNLAELHDPGFSGGLTPSQHLDVVHGGADPRVAATPAQAQGVLEDRYEFSVVDSHDCEVAGGSAPTLDDAIREGRNYLRQYNQDGPHKLELRRVLVLDHSEAIHA